MSESAHDDMRTKLFFVFKQKPDLNHASIISLHFTSRHEYKIHSASAHD